MDLRGFKKRLMSGAANGAKKQQGDALLTRAEWDEIDPYGYMRAEYAENGMPVEYAGETPYVEPPWNPPKIEKKCEPQPDVEKPRPRRRVLRLLSRCYNCGKIGCKNADAKADWNCIHWIPARGVSIKWGDYEVVK